MRSPVLALWTVFFCLCSALSLQGESTKAAITHQVIGRLGDQLLVYSEALWVAYKQNIPFIARPFPHSDALLLAGQETYDDDSIAALDYKLQHLQSLDQIENISENTLFIMRYYPENLQEHQQATPHLPRFDVDWEDKGFRALLRQHFAAKQPLSLIRLPQDKINVAVHVRLGTGVDPHYAPIGLPLKFPPIEWYAKQLQDLLMQKPHAKWYVYVFTDDPDPSKVYQDLIQRIEPHWLIKSKRVQFAWRKEGNFHNKNVLEDFFSLAQFDCIIRGMSNFSFIASQLGDPCLDIYPTAYHRHRNAVPSITQTDWQWRKKLPKKG